MTASLIFFYAVDVNCRSFFYKLRVVSKDFKRSFFGRCKFLEGKGVWLHRLKPRPLLGETKNGVERRKNLLLTNKFFA